MAGERRFERGRGDQDDGRYGHYYEAHDPRAWGYEPESDAEGPEGYVGRDHIGWSRLNPRHDQHGFRNFGHAGRERPAWFGGEASVPPGATGSRRDFTGVGPRNYARRDERIYEDICDRLTADDQVDASEIGVGVKAGEVTLEGSVPDRGQRRRAEDCAGEVSGVVHVQNNLRVRPAEASGEER